MTSIMSPVLKARVDTCRVANNKYEVQNMSQPNEAQNMSQPNEGQNVSQPNDAQNMSQPNEGQNMSQPNEIQNMSQPMKKSIKKITQYLRTFCNI